MRSARLKVEYLRRGLDEGIEDMHNRIAAVCELYVKDGWNVVNIDFTSQAVEVWDCAESAEKLLRAEGWIVEGSR